MAESFQHQNLVKRIVKAVLPLIVGCDEAICFADGVSDTDGSPFLIGGFRPDVYAVGESIEIVGEAKPAWDVESLRTEKQLRSFLGYVEARSYRHLVLSVHWTSAKAAKCVLRNFASDWLAVRERVHVLDGLTPLAIRRKELKSAPGPYPRAASRKA